MFMLDQYNELGIELREAVVQGLQESISKNDRIIA